MLGIAASIDSAVGATNLPGAVSIETGVRPSAFAVARSVSTQNGPVVWFRKIASVVLRSTGRPEYVNTSGKGGSATANFVTAPRAVGGVPLNGTIQSDGLLVVR